jgi:hypothetical protein
MEIKLSVMLEMERKVKRCPPTSTASTPDITKMIHDTRRSFRLGPAPARWPRH